MDRPPDALFPDQTGAGNTFIKPAPPRHNTGENHARSW